jgi:hypothetical protein
MMRTNMIPKRKDIVPGHMLFVRKGKALRLNAYLMLSGMMHVLDDNGVVFTLTKPRKIDGVNLVRVRVENTEYEVFYCDLLRNCETTHGTIEVE